MKIERSRELYAAIRTFCPKVNWNESKWRAYKATRVCLPTQRLWLHFAIEDLLRQTEGKVTFKEIEALMQEDLTPYREPPLIRQVDDDFEELRRKLIMAGHTKPDLHLIVWQIHQQGLKGEPAAKAAGVSKQTFSRHLAQVYDLINEKYIETESDTIILGGIRMYMDGKLYSDQILDWTTKALNRELETPVADSHWLHHYFFMVQNTAAGQPEKTAPIDAWLKYKIIQQEQAKARENSNR